MEQIIQTFRTLWKQKPASRKAIEETVQNLKSGAIREDSACKIQEILTTFDADLVKIRVKNDKIWTEIHRIILHYDSDIVDGLC